MEEATRKKYLEQLREIKQRGLIFEAFSDRSDENFPEHAAIEIAVMQLWRILEMLAFGFVLGIGKQAAANYANFVKYKNAEKFLTELSNGKKDFFPKPIIQKKSGDVIEWSNPAIGTYLDANGFISLFKHCNRIIQPSLVGAVPIVLSECKEVNKKWYGKIVALLNCHLVENGNKAFLFQMGAPDEQPSCTLFESIGDDLIKESTSEAVSLGSDVSLNDHMRRQISYLRRSCELYDAGHFDEAIRLAVNIRVLLHDTEKSRSLLDLMGVKSKIKIATSFGYRATLPAGFEPTAIIPLFANSAEGGVHAPFPISSPQIQLTVDDWWNETVWMQSTTLSRKQIILACANKEGGAHISESVPQSIVEMRKGIAAVTSMTVNGIEVGTPANHHFVLVRQFAHELLASADFVKLQS